MPKPHENYYLNWILRIAAAANVQLSTSSEAVYLEKLQNLTAEEMRRAGERTVDEWAEASKMPPIGFILERAIVPEYERPIGQRFESVADIDPERCPKGWTPADVFAAHLTQEKIRGAARRPLPTEDPQDFPTVATLGRQAGITPEQVKNWLDGGKDAQAEFMSRMESDSEWIALASRLGAFPGLSAKLPKTVVPSDPAERKTWATKQAETQGWR